MNLTPDLILYLFCAAATLILYLPGLKSGLNLADEGYLWYGSLRAAEGAIPIRDFRAYDPGRYYWCAWWMKLLGHTLLSVRTALLIVQLIAVLAAAYTISLAGSGWWPALIGALTTALWMHPRHKQFEILLATLGPLCAVALATTPSSQQLLLSGIFVGSCFLFGLNHALYNGAGLFLLTLLLAWHDSFANLSEILWYPLGVAVGLLPALISFALTPNLAASYWQHKVVRILRRGSANLALPIPWPWRVRPHQVQGLPATTRSIMTIGTIVIPAIYLLVIVSALFPTTQPMGYSWPTVAVACIGLFYLHHYLSRADLAHLTQSIPPFLILLSLLASTHETGWLLLVLFATLSGFAIYLYFVPIDWLRLPNTATQGIIIDASTYTVPVDLANYLAHVQQLVDRYTEQGDSVFIAPLEVTLYPLFGRKPAVYDTFPVYPASDEEQLKMIDQLDESGAKFALVNNQMFDKRDALRFSNSHPLVWRHLQHQFQPIDDAILSKREHALFLKRKLPADNNQDY